MAILFPNIDFEQLASLADSEEDMRFDPTGKQDGNGGNGNAEGNAATPGKANRFKKKFGKQEEEDIELEEEDYELNTVIYIPSKYISYSRYLLFVLRISFTRLEYIYLYPSFLIIVIHISINLFPSIPPTNRKTERVQAPNAPPWELPSSTIPAPFSSTMKRKAAAAAATASATTTTTERKTRRAVWELPLRRRPPG